MTESQNDKIILPKELTAESGAKELLIGEFFVEVEHSCSACYFNGPDEECEACGGEIDWTQKHQIPWPTIKEIYKKIVDQIRL